MFRWAKLTQAAKYIDFPVKRTLIWFGILALLLQVPVFGQGQKSFKVVIDAGHGGHDSGTRGKKVWEKDIALTLALKLGEMIEQQMPDVQVIYTRKTDVFIELHRRAQIANEHHADLFISIHCNGVK
ncbi:MAG: N-acetylmuramoyl-L-alanine amidase, partial [Bacteroidales bacterium]|nr:N-acetylmuramoyl-L-alanine amidase [Bacteroidales bacterium]